MNEPFRIAGWFLLSGALFAMVGAGTPPYKQWYSPLPEALRVIAAHPIGWRCIHAGFLIGTALVAVGMALYARALSQRPGGALALVAAVTFGIATVFWSVNIAFRLTVTPWAANELVASGVVPPLYQPFSASAGLLFAFFAAFAYASDACAGWAFLRAELLPRWVAWTSIVVGIAGAPIVAYSGPWVIYVPPLLLGISLVRLAP